MHAREGETTNQAASTPTRANVRLTIALSALVACLLAARALYHFAYFVHDPFALSTFSDGQVYEEAARDLLAHPPLGTQPFFLQGLYAYWLAIGIGWRGLPVDALALQIALAACACIAFFFAVRAWFDLNSALLSTCALLSSAALAFYENKYLSAELGVAANIGVLFAFGFVRGRARAGSFLLGVTSALSLLARPNLVLALPLTAAAIWRLDRRLAPPRLAAFALGLALGVAPMALRNALVTGRPSLFPSHGGGIPFYIGNHPGSTGLWNDAGGLLSGQVLLERRELSRRLQLQEDDPLVDDAIGRALYRRAFSFIRSEPCAWLRIEAHKLWLLAGNHEFVHDYDWFGEAELLGAMHVRGLPFGFLLAAGLFGLGGLARGKPEERALFLLLLGQMIAVVAANLLWFTSAQNRLPLVVPLAFAIGPAASFLFECAREKRLRRAGIALAAISCSLIAGQAFVSRHAAPRPSAAHYFNLANVEESLGRFPDALRHYQRAAEVSPKQPLFWFRLAYLARRLGQRDEAERALDRLDAMSDLPELLRRAANDERRQLLRR